MFLLMPPVSLDLSGNPTWSGGYEGIRYKVYRYLIPFYQCIMTTSLDVLSCTFSPLCVVYV